MKRVEKLRDIERVAIERARKLLEAHEQGKVKSNEERGIFNELNEIAHLKLN